MADRRFGFGGQSDEALWRARFDAAMDEAAFWRNFAFLRPYGVPAPTDVTLRVKPSTPAPQATVTIPHQRAYHPAVAELTERALRNNRGGRS